MHSNMCMHVYNIYYIYEETKTEKQNSLLRVKPFYKPGPEKKLREIVWKIYDTF